MKVRQLIEHLAQFDGDLDVMTRDYEVVFVLHPIEESEIALDDFIGYDSTEQQVVAIG